jgi:hypothetical protein
VLFLHYTFIFSLPNIIASSVKGGHSFYLHSLRFFPLRHCPGVFSFFFTFFDEGERHRYRSAEEGRPGKKHSRLEEGGGERRLRFADFVQKGFTSVLRTFFFLSGVFPCHHSSQLFFSLLTPTTGCGAYDLFGGERVRRGRAGRNNQWVWLRKAIFFSEDPRDIEGYGEGIPALRGIDTLVAVSGTSLSLREALRS